VGAAFGDTGEMNGRSGIGNDVSVSSDGFGQLCIGSGGFCGADFGFGVVLLSRLGLGLRLGQRIGGRIEAGIFVSGKPRQLGVVESVGDGNDIGVMRPDLIVILVDLLLGKRAGMRVLG